MREQLDADRAVRVRIALRPRSGQSFRSPHSPFTRISVHVAHTGRAHDRKLRTAGSHCTGIFAPAPTLGKAVRKTKGPAAHRTASLVDMRVGVTSMPRVVEASRAAAVLKVRNALDRVCSALAMAASRPYSL